MSFSIKTFIMPLSLTLLVASGCNSDEAEQGAKQIEQETKAAADATKEKTQEAANKVKEEMPGIIQNMKDTYKESEKELKENTLQKGDSATVKKEAYLALSEESYDELYQLIEINDLEGAEKIEKEQLVKVISQDSEVEVIEREIRRAKVKVIDSGDEGYLPTSLLEPKN